MEEAKKVPNCPGVTADKTKRGEIKQPGDAKKGKDAGKATKDQVSPNDTRRGATVQKGGSGKKADNGPTVTPKSTSRGGKKAK